MMMIDDDDDVIHIDTFLMKEHFHSFLACSYILSGRKL